MFGIAQTGGFSTVSPTSSDPHGAAKPDMEECYHYYHMVHDLHTDKVLEGLHLVFVELPKFKAKNLTEKKMQILWLRFLA